MSAVRRRLSFQPSRARLIIWGVCLVVIAILLVRQFQSEGPRWKGGSPNKDGTGAVSVPATMDDTDREGLPAVRFGVLARAAHLVALSGLEMNLYALAARQDGWIETLVFARSPGLSRAMREGDLDVASLPIREAVALYLEDRENAPRIVAGGATGDEMFVVRNGVTEPSFENLGPVNVGILEPPILDIRAALKLDSGNSPTVVLTAADALAQSLVSRTIDLAVVPEPLASQVAALSGSQVLGPDSVEGGRLAAGSVLVMSKEFLEKHRKLASQLVQAHELSAFTVQQDPEIAIRRALALLEAAGVSSPPDLFWTESIRKIQFVTDIPDESLQHLLSIGGEGMEAGELVIREFQQEARRVLEENTGGE